MNVSEASIHSGVLVPRCSSTRVSSYVTVKISSSFKYIYLYLIFNGGFVSAGSRLGRSRRPLVKVGHAGSQDLVQIKNDSIHDQEGIRKGRRRTIVCR